MKGQKKNWWSFHMIIRTEVGTHTYGPACYTKTIMDSFFGTDEEILEYLFEKLPKIWRGDARRFPEILEIRNATLKFLDKSYFDEDEAEGFIIILHCLIKTSLGNSKNWQWKSEQILKKLRVKILS